MNMGKAVGLLVLMILTFPIGGFIWVPILFFGWKYVKFCIKIDLIVIYLIIRLPLWFFIQLPLYSLKYSTQKIDEVFSRGFNALNRRRKLSIFLMIVFGGFYLFMFPTNMQEFNILSPYFWWNNMRSIAFILVGTVGSVILVLTLIETFSGGVAQEEMPGDWARSQLWAAPGESIDQGVQSAQRAVEGTRKAKRGAKKAKGVYGDIKSAEINKSALKSAIPSDMTKVLADLAESFGLRAGASEAAAAAGSNPLGWLALAVFLLALLIFVAQLVLVTVFFVGYLQFIAPLVLGPVTAALGLGSDYGNYLGGAIADRYLAGIQIQIEPYLDPVLEARQRIYCLLEGPACLRQWRLNNTRNPGSESVGEQYLLEIDRLEVGSGNRLDIAYKNKDYEIPLSFGLSNSRNGLKGINAYNVSYRMKVIDFDRGRKDPYCNTKWRPIDGYDISSWNGFDNPESNDNWGENDLYPGTAANTGFLTMEDFTLKECGLLQPGAGQTRTVVLDVKYDYFSQATLYFDAMAQETLISNPDIEKDWKESETADTPVKSALNVNSPVTYDRDAVLSGEPSQARFSMRASLFTEESNVEYQIKDLEVIKSSEVETAGDPDDQNCRLKPSEDDESILVPAEESSNIIKGNQEDSEDEQSTRWFDSNNNPPFFGCTMKLTNPGSISPEGETLTMGVESNYTVKMDRPLERFRVLNTRCAEAGINCPLLVTMDYANDLDKDSDNWKYKCEGPDAGRSGASAGCSVVNGEGNWAQILDNMMTGDEKLESRLERGEIAVDPAVYEPIEDYVLEDYQAENEFAIGLKDSEIKKLENSEAVGDSDGKGYAIISEINSEDYRDTELIGLEHIVCREQPSGIGGKEKYKKYVINNEGGEDSKLVAFSPIYADCNNPGFWDGFINADTNNNLLLNIATAGGWEIFQRTAEGAENLASEFGKDMKKRCAEEEALMVYDKSDGASCLSVN